MAIQSLETFTTQTVSVVRLTTDDGEQGFGQISPYNADIAADVFHRQIAPHALGRELSALETLVESIPAANLKFPGSYVRRALCGLDTAIWDLRGKRAGEPVYALCDGSGGSVSVYGSSMRRDITPDDEADRLESLRDEYGYDAFKIRVGASHAVGTDEDEWPGRSEELVETVRDRLGPEVTLFVDANSAYTAEGALELDQTALAPNDVAHFEEPCPYWELEWTRRVRDEGKTTVAGGEQDCFLWQWERIVEGPVVDIVQPDICYLGGFTRTRRVAEMAHAEGLPCRPHVANHSMLVPFTLHFLASIDNAAPFLEYSIEDHWGEGLLDPEPEIIDGELAIPDEPGWGMYVNSDWLDAAEHRISEV